MASSSLQRHCMPLVHKQAFRQNIHIFKNNDLKKAKKKRFHLKQRVGGGISSRMLELESVQCRKNRAKVEVEFCGSENIYW